VLSAREVIVNSFSLGKQVCRIRQPLKLVHFGDYELAQLNSEEFLQWTEHLAIHSKAPGGQTTNGRSYSSLVMDRLIDICFKDSRENNAPQFPGQRSTARCRSATSPSWEYSSHFQEILRVFCELKSMCLQVLFKSGESTSGMLSSPSNQLL
jgi:hypothetical protein